MHIYANVQEKELVRGNDASDIFCKELILPPIPNMEYGTCKHPFTLLETVLETNLTTGAVLYRC